MTSSVPTLPLPSDPVRQRLAVYFKGLIEEGEEGGLSIRGVDSKASTADLVTSAALRAAEYYAFLKALVPGPTILPANPSDVSKAILLIPAEIAELAALHDIIAAQDERRGNHGTAQRRRDRADQLRELLRGNAL